jgi:hypothetical protein
MPFRYGQACLTVVPVLTVKVEIESTGRKRAAGFSADCLPPQWFVKDPSKSFRQDVEDQLTAYRIARDLYLREGRAPAAASELWESALPRVIEEASQKGINSLTASFGSSLLERAMVDAVCRLRGVSFFDALRQDMLGMRTSKSLPPTPTTRFICRHTVGLADPITASEIPPDQRVDDSLPQALDEAIEFYGLTHFKVKLAGSAERDLERISRLAVILDQRCKGGYHVTLDGNEQYRDLGALEGLLEAMRSKPYGGGFIDAVLYLEQPLPREHALDPALGPSVARLGERKPVIIDESDDLPQSFQRAAELGYRGVSHKNCKGIFKSLRNRALILDLNRDAGKPLYFQTGEDLAAVGVLALQQELASLSALGVEHCERNGHHYFRGLDHLPKEERSSAAVAHADLYEERGDSAFLRIEDGIIKAESVQGPGYGYSSTIAFGERVPLEGWKFERLGVE